MHAVHEIGELRRTVTGELLNQSLRGKNNWNERHVLGLIIYNIKLNEQDKWYINLFEFGNNCLNARES